MTDKPWTVNTELPDVSDATLRTMNDAERRAYCKRELRRLRELVPLHETMTVKITEQPRKCLECAQPIPPESGVCCDRCGGVYCWPCCRRQRREKEQRD